MSLLGRMTFHSSSSLAELVNFLFSHWEIQQKYLHMGNLDQESYVRSHSGSSTLVCPRPPTTCWGGRGGSARLFYARQASEPACHPGVGASSAGPPHGAVSRYSSPGRTPSSTQQFSLSPRGGADMAVDGTGPARLFCPVAGCPCGDPLQARGWASPATMQSHVDAHLAGTLAGQVPQNWLDSRDRQRCGVCGLSVSKRFGVHPTCRPARDQAVVLLQLCPTWTLSGPAQPGPCGTLVDWQGSVGAGADKSLAMVATYNDATSWAELFMLPHCVLCPPPRGGRKHQRAAAAYTLDRLRRWHEGERLELWSSHSKPPPSRARDDSRRSLAESLAREGFDRKACAALLATGLCRNSSRASWPSPARAIGASCSQLAACNRSGP